MVRTPKQGWNSSLKVACWFKIEWGRCFLAEPMIKTYYWFLTFGRFSPLGSDTVLVWPSLSSQKTITKLLFPRYWQYQGWKWIVEDYYFHSRIQFKWAPGRRNGAEGPGFISYRAKGILTFSSCLFVSFKVWPHQPYDLLRFILPFPFPLLLFLSDWVLFLSWVRWSEVDCGCIIEKK